MNGSTARVASYLPAVLRRRLGGRPLDERVGPRNDPLIREFVRWRENGIARDAPGADGPLGSEVFALQDGAPAAARGRLEIDLRAVPPRVRRATLLHAFDALYPGETLHLTSDRELDRERRRFDRLRAGQSSWTPLEQGPERWRASLSKR